MEKNELLLQSIKQKLISENIDDVKISSFINGISDLLAKENSEQINLDELTEFLSDFRLTDEEYLRLINLLESSGIEIKNDISENSFYDVEKCQSFLSELENNYSVLHYNKEGPVDDNRELVKLAQEGDENAKTLLIKNNIGLIISIAREFGRTGADYEDLVSEGTIGFLNALKNYDPSQNVKFTTYAVPCIKSQIKLFLTNNSRSVRLPANVVVLQRRIRAASDELYKKIQRNPTAEEIFEELDGDIPLDKIKDILAINVNSISLNESYDDDGNTTIEDFISSDEENDPRIIESSHELMDAIEEGIKTLGEREGQILRLRLFRDDLTLEDIAKVYKISRERVRQIEAKAKFTLSKYLKEHGFDYEL